jgi:tetratricopeptide (TPR) repeat protein
VTPPVPPTPPWIKDPFLTCPCGSGRPFKNCCRDVLRSVGDNVKLDARTPALRRAELARYIGWVFQHTQPLLEAGVPAGDLDIANVDLHAIVGFADRVAFDMKAVAPADVVTFFSRLQQYLYSLPGLPDAILSLKAGWLWFRGDDLEGCKRLLEPLHTCDLSSVRYAPLLELYLDFFSDAPVMRQIKVVERILELRRNDVLPSPAGLLHYAMLKGLLVLMLGDHESLLQITNQAAQEHLDAVEREDDAYSLNVVAMTRQLLWRFSADPVEFGRAIEARRRLLAIPNVTSAGRQNFHQSLGMLLAEGGAYADAVKHLQQAGNSAEALVNLADAYANMGRVDDADEVLRHIDRKRLGEAMKLECLSADASVAFARGDLPRVKSLIAEAQGLALPDLYFQRSRDRLCIALLEYANARQGAEREAAGNRVRGVLGWIRYIAQFLELKPNIGGWGLNLNRLFEGEPPKK